MTAKISKHIDEAHNVLISLGLPRAQHNERSTLCLLALLNLAPSKTWAQAENPLVGITPIMDWLREHYDKGYAPNSREMFRRQTIHQFVDAGCNRNIAEIFIPTKINSIEKPAYALYAD
jgi:hypothetical protein